MKEHLCAATPWSCLDLITFSPLTKHFTLTPPPKLPYLKDAPAPYGGRVSDNSIGSRWFMNRTGEVRPAGQGPGSGKNAQMLRNVAIWDRGLM
jgi:hypothetical protein